MKVGLPYLLESEITLINSAKNRNILVVSTHPDDIESECAGTGTHAKESSSRITLLVITSGHEKEKSHREEEARTARKIVGIDEIVFLGNPDGTVGNTKALQVKFVYYIRLWKPDIIFLMIPILLYHCI